MNIMRWSTSCLSYLSKSVFSFSPPKKKRHCQFCVLSMPSAEIVLSCLAAEDRHPCWNEILSELLGLHSVKFTVKSALQVK